MFYAPTWFGPWGYLPLAAPLAAFLPARLGARVVPNAGALDRLIYGAVLFFAVGTVSLRVFVQLGWLSPWALFAVIALLWIVGRAGATTLARLRDRRLVPIALVASAAFLVCVAAAYFQPVWTWDSLGYHLPYVDFVLQGHGVAGIPAGVPYIDTYPHNIELGELALRLFLPDDRLVDLGQLPWGLLGALATAGIARKLGATTFASVAVGLLWLTMPGVLLQLPTDYVDAAAAAYLLCAVYFLVGVPTAHAQIFAGLALGLFLGSKPTAPLGTAVCGIVLLLRAREHKRATAIACVLIVLLGAEAYARNVIRWHNPTWPVTLKLGPIVLSGTNTVEELLTSAPKAPHLVGHFRVLRSWLTLVPPPMFDMRVGGFGPPFVLALVPATLVLWRRRSLRLALLVLACFVAPDPAVARYTLALPAVVLAIAASWRAWDERATPWLVGALAAFNLACAWPGFTGLGPPLGSYVVLSWADRDLAVGADEQGEAIRQARRAYVHAGEAAAFDRFFEFPHLLWAPDLSTRVVRVPNGMVGTAREALLAHEGVRLAIVSDEAPLDRALWQRLYHCEVDPCVVYRRR